MLTALWRGSATTRLAARRTCFSARQFHSWWLPRTMAQAVTSAPASGSAVLEAKEDKYDGIIISPEALPADEAVFREQLHSSLDAWRASGKRGIWLQVPLSHVHLVPAAVNSAGFEPHHASSGHIMLIKWLPNTPNTLPPAPTHQVGVGAFVLNERHEVLVVQERNGPLKGHNVWKMPTGLANAGEDITDAAVREVLEETGIHAKCDAVLVVRQAHGFVMGDKSDLFVVCALVPEPGQGEPRPQESEIAAAKWMPLQDFNDQQFMTGVALFEKIRERCTAWAQGRYKGMRADKLDASFLQRSRADLTIWGEDHAPAAASGNGNGGEEQPAAVTATLANARI